MVTQFHYKVGDSPGAVLITDVESAEDGRQILSGLPIVAAGLLGFVLDPLSRVAQPRGDVLTPPDVEQDLGLFERSQAEQQALGLDDVVRRRHGGGPTLRAGCGNRTRDHMITSQVLCQLS